MKHIVYETTNMINGKIYRGIHSTKDIDDGYLGSGTYLNHAFEKYGRENFKRKILSFHEDRDAAFIEEGRIVDAVFIERKDTYNIVLGGKGCGLHTDMTKEKNIKMYVSLEYQTIG